MAGLIGIRSHEERHADAIVLYVAFGHVRGIGVAAEGEVLQVVQNSSHGRESQLLAVKRVERVHVLEKKTGTRQTHPGIEVCPCGLR
jgi:hypothetical protein